MSERSKEHDWKSCISEMVSRVRIPLSPPFYIFFTKNIKYKFTKKILKKLYNLYFIINTNGNLGGYSGGLTRKKWLINHEKMNINI